MAWLYWQGATGTATALLLWTLVVVLLDNVLRPILMTKGANLPMLLMFAGVIGGLLAFGLIGIFVGPVVLAVSYTLLVAWMGDRSGRTPRRARFNDSDFRAQADRRRRCVGGGGRELEAAAEREVEIHALHALLGLHPDQRGARGAQRQLPLLDEPEIGAPDLELGLHHGQRLLIVGERLRQDLLALARGDLGGQRAFHFAKGAQSHRGILGDRLFLLGGANLDLRLERAAPEERREQAGADVPHRIVVILQHEQLARDRAEAGRQRDHRQPGRLGLANPVERHRHAPLRGDHVRPPLEQLRRQPAGTSPGKPGNCGAVAAAAAG